MTTHFIAVVSPFVTHKGCDESLKVKKNPSWPFLMKQNETDRQTILLLLCRSLVAHSIRILMFMMASSVPINYIQTSLYPCTLCDMLLSRLVARCHHHCSEYKSPFLGYDIWYDIFVNCNWVDSRWQQCSTHLHTNNTQNNTINN